MRLNCNAVEFDKNLKQHLLEAITNTTRMQHVQCFRWKRIIVSNPTYFKLTLTDLNNNPVAVKNDGSHVLLIFQKRI